MLNNNVICRWLDTSLLTPSDNASLANMLECHELQKAVRFRRLEDRQTYIAMHALVRVMLSSIVAHPVQSWRYTVGLYGKPEPILTQADLPLHFNCSRTNGLAVVAM